ncbi:MAG TPA: hypothetical protein VK771_08550, partial [Acidimicrobiia bacterium]|nr:hypothetical protein [Acidimicrobiia bacterium]
MSRRTGLGPTVVLAAVAVVASACSSHSSPHANRTTHARTTTPVPAFSVTPTRDVTVSPLFVSSGSARPRPGSRPPTHVEIRPTADHTLRVGFREHDVGGTGPQWEAAGRDAVAAATLMTGAPLANREIDFDVTGPLNGLGVGALLTIAVIALIRGDRLGTDVTMIGTINPDGAIGPAGGTPYAIADVLAAHERRVLIPQHDHDGLSPGATNGVDVSEVPDLVAAYRQFTGTTLPQLPPSANTRLDAVASTQIGSIVATWLARYQASATDFQSLAPDLRQDLQSYANIAGRDHQQAETLATQGSQAGAFQAAVSAAALMNAITRTGQALPVLLAQGTLPFVSRVTAGASINGQVRGLVAKLNTFTPQSVSDAGALISAYSNAIDALSLSSIATGLFAAHVANRQQAIDDAAEGAIYVNVAATLVDAAGDMLAAGRGLGGDTLGPRPDLGDIATFFRLAAEANLSAFQTVVVAPYAYVARTNVSAARAAFAGTDLNYGLAQTGDTTISALPSYFGGPSTADYARLGGALAMYDRTAELLATYNSFGRIAPNTLQLAGIANTAAF